MQVSQPDPRAHIDLLLRSLPESGKKEEEAVAKVKQIGTILGGDPTLKNDSALIDRLFTAIDALPDETIQEKCRTVLLGEAPSVPVTLTIPEHELKNYGEGLWDKITEEGIKKLVIEREGKPIVYEGRVLQQLVEKRPWAEDLVEMWTIKFEEGKELNETKATLLLCGGYIKGLMRSGMKEAQQETIDFSNLFEESYDAFLDLLNEVRTGQKEMDEESYKIITEALDYTKWNPPIPKGAFGPAEWEKMGIKIDHVPPVPEVILKHANPENYLIVLIPGNVGFSELIDRSGIKIKYVWDELKAEPCNQPTGRPYWVAIEKELMPDSCNKEERKDQLNIASEDKIHQAPSILEAVACNIASMKTTGKGLWGMYRDTEFPMLTCCREDTLGGKKLSDERRFVVCCSPSGFFVNYYYGGCNVGVARLLREF